MIRKHAGINNLLLYLILLLALVIISQPGYSSPSQDSGQQEKQLPSGLLLGISTADRGYQTLYITYKSNTVSVVTAGTGLLVPRDDGFWMIRQNHIDVRDAYQELQMAFSADYLDVRKAGADTLQLQIEPGQVAQHYYPYFNRRVPSYYFHSSLNIAFVGNNYVTLWSDAYGYTGGAHPFTSRSWDTYNLDDLARNNVSNIESYFQQDYYKYQIPLSRFFGSGAKETLEAAARKYRNANPERSNVLADKVLSDTYWGLDRGQGHWQIKGILGPRDQVVREQFALFDTDLRPPQEIVSHDELVVDWNAVVAKVPSAEDAFSSPENNLLVVFTKQKMIFYRVVGSTIGDSVGEVNLAAYDKPRVVMIQWCTGEYVDNWADEAKRYLR